MTSHIFGWGADVNNYLRACNNLLRDSFDNTLWGMANAFTKIKALIYREQTGL